MNEQELRAYLEKEIGVDDLLPEDRDDILVRITETVLSRCVVAILEKLPEEDRAHFENLLQEKGFDEAYKHIESRIPNLKEMLNAEIKEELEETKKLIAE